MDDYVQPDIINESSPHATVPENEGMDLHSHWLQLCTVGVSALAASTTAWLHLTAAAMALHTQKVVMSRNDKQAIREHVVELKEKAKGLKRLNIFSNIRNENDSMPDDDFGGTEGSSYGERDSPRFAGEPSTPEYTATQQSGGSMRSNKKRKTYLLTVMEDGYKTMASSLDKLSMALVDVGKKYEASKYDGKQNSQIYEALNSLGLGKEYLHRCYCYLCDNPGKAALLVAAPNELRAKLLETIMKGAGDG